MNPTEIINKALLDTHTDSGNYDPTTVWLEALNIVRDEVINDIVSLVKEDFYWDEVKATSIIWESEYNIEQIQWTPALDIKKINKLFVKYDEDSEYYTRSTYQNPSTLSKDLDYYSDNQSTAIPFFYFQDNSIFLYPAFKKEITDWVKMNVIYNPAELTNTSTETNIEIQKDKHYILVIGMWEHIYRSQGKINEADNARVRFREERTNFVTELKARYNQKVKRNITWLESFR